MGLTAEKVSVEYGDGLARATIDVTFDSSYPTGGEDVAPLLAAANVGRAPHLSDVSQITFFEQETKPGAHNVELDRSTGKLRLNTTLATEATNASDQSAVTMRVRLTWGRWAR